MSVRGLIAMIIFITELVLKNGLNTTNKPGVWPYTHISDISYLGSSHALLLVAGLPDLVLQLGLLPLQLYTHTGRVTTEPIQDAV